MRVHRKCHISMYFLKKAASHFLPREKMSFFREKNTIFPDDTRKIMCRRGPFWNDHLFWKVEENIIFLCFFFEKDYLFRASGKRKYGFPCSEYIYIYIYRIYIYIEYIYIYRIYISYIYIYKKLDNMIYPYTIIY